MICRFYSFNNANQRVESKVKLADFASHKIIAVHRA